MDILLHCVILPTDSSSRFEFEATIVIPRESTNNTGFGKVRCCLYVRNLAASVMAGPTPTPVYEGRFTEPYRNFAAISTDELVDATYSTCSVSRRRTPPQRCTTSLAVFFVENVLGCGCVVRVVRWYVGMLICWHVSMEALAVVLDA